MDGKTYVFIVIDRVEYYVTKEIERAMGDCNENEKSFASLHQRLLECINARREVNYESVYANVQELLDDNGYDEEYIDRFTRLFEFDMEEREIIKTIDDGIEKLSKESLHRFIGRLYEYMNTRKNFAGDPMYENIESLLKKYGFIETYIDEFVRTIQMNH